MRPERVHSARNRGGRPLSVREQRTFAALERLEHPTAPELRKLYELTERRRMYGEMCPCTSPLCLSRS